MDAGRSILIVGGDGFVGSHALRALSEVGWRARSVDRAHGGPDLGDPAADWESALQDADVVVNLAGKAHDVRRHSDDQAADYMAVNALGVGRMARGAVSVGARRFIQVSTVKVLGDCPSNGSRFLETDPLHPSGIYAESKAEGERLVRQALEGRATECVVVRLPLVFGTPFKGNLAVVERAIRGGVPLPLSHPTISRRTYVQMADLESLFLQVVSGLGPLPPVIHACSTPDLTAADVARMVGEEVGRKPRLVSVPATTIRRVAALVGRPEYASKVCDPMLVSDDATRAALEQLSG